MSWGACAIDARRSPACPVRRKIRLSDPMQCSWSDLSDIKWACYAARCPAEPGTRTPVDDPIGITRTHVPCKKYSMREIASHDVRRETRPALDQDQAGRGALRHSWRCVATIGANHRLEKDGCGLLATFRMCVAAAERHAWPHSLRQSQIVAGILPGHRAERHLIALKELP